MRTVVAKDLVLKRIFSTVREYIFKTTGKTLSDDALLKILRSQSTAIREGIISKHPRIKVPYLGSFKIKEGREASVIVKREAIALGLTGDARQAYIDAAKVEWKKNPTEFLENRRIKKKLPTEIDFGDLDIPGLIPTGK